MAYLLLSDSMEYRNFLRTNMNRIFIQIVEASEDDDLIYFSNTLPPKVSNLDSVYYAAFCFWYLYLTQDNRIYLLVKNIIAYIAPLIDDFNLLQDRYYKDTAPHEYIADKLTQRLNAADKETARLQDEIARLQEKLDEANKANAQLAKLQEKVSWLEDENRFLQDRISESQIIYAPQETPRDIQAFIKRMNTQKIGLVGGNDDWQSKASAVFNVHTAVTEMNKVDSLKNCDIVIVNTAFISHSMYFAVQKTAQNALFMYIDNLNMDTIATLLYHKYNKTVL